MFRSYQPNTPTNPMNELIDKRIAELEKELAGLRRQKLAELQEQMAALEASLTGAPAAAPRKGRPPGSGAKGKRQKATAGWAADLDARPQTASAGESAKGRGRPPGKRVSDDAALAKITRIVAAAGKDGTSARKVSQASGLFYPRVITLMDGNFKKSGEGKWTRYTVK